MKVNYKILDMQNKMYTKIVKGLLLIAVVFLGTISAMGQDVMTKIKDGTKGGSTRTPVSGSILELESLNKGFITPRMTTGQRDAIKVTKANHGMMIFNTTSGCFNYYDSLGEDGTGAAPRWLSICGTPPPAVFHIPDNLCNSTDTKVPQALSEGKALTAADYVVLTVKVEQAGTYDIIAKTDNGYYFSKSGTFPTMGMYTLILEGAGEPLQGHQGAKTDILTFLFNNKLSTCHAVSVKVQPAAVKYDVQCVLDENTVQGKYYVGLNVNNTNKIKLYVRPTQIGNWVIRTTTVNGVGFYGKGTFTADDLTKTEGVVVYLYASGKPKADGEHSYTLITNSQVDPASPQPECNISVGVEEIELEVVCADAKTKAHGTYTQDVEVGNDNYMTVVVDAKSTGKASFSTDKVNGVEFKTETEVAFDKLGKKTITLKAFGKPIKPGVNTFTLTASEGLKTPCKIDVNVKAQPISFALSCSSIKVEGFYSPHANLNDKNFMEVEVDVDYPGKVMVFTDEVNGVKFAGEITDAKQGKHKVKLLATGKAKDGGPHKYTINTNSTGAGNKTCDQTITYVYRTIRVLGFGHGVYSPGSNRNERNAVSALLSSGHNFGPDGVVKVEDIELVRGLEPSLGGDWGVTQATKVKGLIQQDIDIVIIGHNFIPSDDTIKILEQFVKKKKGVLIHAQENNEGQTAALINAIAKNGGAAVGDRGNSRWNVLKNGVDDEILKGPFRDLKAKKDQMGSDVNNSFHVTSVPKDMKVLYTKTDGTAAWFIKHNDLGYIYCGDSGWMAGREGNTDRNVWPFAISGGKPTTKDYWVDQGNHGLGTKSTYNSYLFANTMAWAIKYVQENTLQDYEFDF